LTDNPAIKNMQAIELAAASLLNQQSISLPEKEESMNKELLALLGLSEDADDKTVLAACAALKQLSDKSANLVAKIETLTIEKEALAATSGQVDSSKYVPINVVTELQTQLAALSTGIESDKVTALIQANKTKLPTPGLQTWAATQSLAALSAYLETAPEIAALSGLQTGGNAPSDVDGSLSSEELAVCSALGTDVEEFKKTKGKS